MGCPLISGSGHPWPRQAVFALGCPLWQCGRLPHGWGCPSDTSLTPQHLPAGYRVPCPRDLLSALGAPNWEFYPF